MLVLFSATWANLLTRLRHYYFKRCVNGSRTRGGVANLPFVLPKQQGFKTWLLQFLLAGAELGWYPLFWEPEDGLTSCFGSGLQVEPKQEPPYAPPFFCLITFPCYDARECLHWFLTQCQIFVHALQIVLRLTCRTRPKGLEQAFAPGRTELWWCAHLLVPYRTVREVPGEAVWRPMHGYWTFAKVKSLCSLSFSRYALRIVQTASCDPGSFHWSNRRILLPCGARTVSSPVQRWKGVWRYREKYNQLFTYCQTKLICKMHL